MIALHRKSYHLAIFLLVIGGIATGVMTTTAYHRQEYLPAVVTAGALLYLLGDMGRDLVNDAYNETGWWDKRNIEQLKEERDHYKQELAQFTETLPAQFQLVNEGSEVELIPAGDSTE